MARNRREIAIDAQNMLRETSKTLQIIINRDYHIDESSRNLIYNAVEADDILASELLIAALDDAGIFSAESAIAVGLDWFADPQTLSLRSARPKPEPAAAPTGEEMAF